MENLFGKIIGLTGLRKERIFTFLVVFMMFGNTYLVPFLPVGFGEVLLFVFMPFYLKSCLNFMSDAAEKLFYIHFIYVAVVSCFFINLFDASLSEPINRMLRNGYYYFFIFVLGKNLCNRFFFEKYVIFFCVFLAAFVILQYAYHTLTGGVLPGVLFNMRMGNGVESGYRIYQSSLATIDFWGQYRPNGFLCEPAHVAQSLFIGTMIALHSNSIFIKKKKLLALFFSVAVLMTQSTTGLFALCFVWGAFLFFQKKMFFLKLILVILAFSILIVQNNSNDEFNALSRAKNSMSQSSADASAHDRIYKGFDDFFKLPIPLQFCGTGWGLYKSVVKNSKEFDATDRNEYMSSFTSVLFASGYCGFIIFTIAFGILFYNSNRLGRIAVVGYWILSMGCSIYVSPVFVWIMMIVLLNNKNAKGETLFINNDKCQS